MYVCPVITIWGSILNAVVFYCTKRYVMIYCHRPKKALGVTKQLKFFYACILVTLGISCLPIFAMLREIPSCGPINGISIRAAFDDKLNKAPSVFVNVIDFCTSAVVLLPLCIAMFMY